ncbi:MAG: ABC transporter permease, partial [Anaerolineales bacterium]|nr:ABC transporter permease [Anaerolineales bacterium]
MILVIPIMQLFLLGYSATNDVRNIPLAVLDRSRSVESRELLDSYRAADYFRIAYVVDSEAEIENLIMLGDDRGARIS